MSSKVDFAETVLKDALEIPAVKRAAENAVAASERLLADIAPTSMKSTVVAVENAADHLLHSGNDAVKPRFIAPWHRAVNSRGEVVTRSEAWDDFKNVERAATEGQTPSLDKIEPIVPKTTMPTEPALAQPAPISSDTTAREEKLIEKHERESRWLNSAIQSFRGMSPF